MAKKVFQVGFDLFREVFEEYALGDNLMIFDNLMEKLNPENKTGSIEYNFPIKLDVIIIVLCKGGSGKAMIGLKEINLEKNMLAVILPEQIFQVSEITQDFKGMFIVLKNNFLNLQNYIVEAMTLHRIFTEQYFLKIPEVLINEFTVIYQHIKDKIQEEDNYYRVQVIQNYCSILFYNACNIYIQQNRNDEPKIKNNAEKIFNAFLKEVEKNYRNEHTISYYADKLCITPKYLSSIVSKVSGKSASDWIKQYQLLEAQALLRSSQLTIQQISDKLNFVNQSHFGRFFKRYAGLSPREYKKQYPYQIFNKG